MAQTKARQLAPQYSTDAVGSIYGRAKTDLLAGSIVVVTGAFSNTFIIESASSQSIRRSSGLLYVLDHLCLGGNTAIARPFYVIPYAGDKKVKDGDAIWLGRDGGWSLNKPKTRAVQVGRIIVSEKATQVLLAPQGRY